MGIKTVMPGAIFGMTGCSTNALAIRVAGICYVSRVAQLEQDVSSCRNGLKSNQRLYVVVGVLYEDSETAGGVPVPSHFYKCLMLCTFSGSTMTAASGCAYLFTNEAHTGSYSSGVTSIDAVEARSGFDFFAAVPASLQAAAESSTSELW